MAQNEVTLKGYVRKIELRFAASSGNPVLSIKVPVDRREKNRETGQYESVNTTWWQLTTFGKDAEFQNDNLRDGDLIQFTGMPELETREGKDGTKYTNAVMKFPVIAKVLQAPKEYTGGGTSQSQGFTPPQSDGFGGQQGGFNRTGFDTGGFRAQPDDGVEDDGPPF